MLPSRRVSPVVLFNVFNKLRLDVGFPWNGDGFLHEWLIEVNFIDLQLQLLSDLKYNNQSANIMLSSSQTQKKYYYFNRL